MLESQFTVSGTDHCANRRIAHRQHGKLHAERRRELLRDLRERRALAQPLGALDVHREIEIPEVEPGFSAELLHRPHELPRLAAASPAGFCVGFAGQRVNERVDVGRDVQAEVFEVVAGVDDERDLVAGEQLCQSQRELRAAYAAGDGDEPVRCHLSRMARRTVVAA